MFSRLVTTPHKRGGRTFSFCAQMRKNEPLLYLSLIEFWEPRQVVGTWLGLSGGSIAPYWPPREDPV